MTDNLNNKINMLAFKDNDDLFLEAMAVDNALRNGNLSLEEQEELLQTKTAIGYLLTNNLFTLEDFETLTNIKKNPLFSTRRIANYNYQLLSQFINYIDDNMTLVDERNQKKLILCRFEIMQVLINRGLVNEKALVIAKNQKLKKTLVS